ncbi:hypothetical protein FKM82_021289 [Ascaphus truei]
MISGLLAIVILSLLVWNYLRNRWGGPQYPPGPPALPILGNLWTLKFQLHHDTLIQLAQVYGDVYTVWLGHTPVIVLNGYRAVREVLISHSEDFTGRPVLPLFMDLIGEKGVILTSGYTWKQQRRFALTTLRSLGLGKRRLEALIQEEAQSLLEQFAAREGTPMDLAASVTHSVSNVVSLVVFGKRFLPGDRAFQELHTAAELVVAASGTLWARIYDLAPGLMRLLPGPHKKAFRYFHILCAFIQREIEQHRETLRGQPAAGQEMDVIDFYLTQICKTRGDLSSTYTEDNMVQLVADLFMAGTETVTTTLRWALLYMVAFPDIQEQVQRELDALLDPSRVIRYEDRARLPFTNAVIHEIQRFANVVSVGIVRRCVKETELRGFAVPQVKRTRAPSCSPTCPLSCTTRSIGRRRGNSTPNTSWTRRGTSWPRRRSYRSLQGTVGAWGSSWPGPSCSCSSPASYGGSASGCRRERPSSGWTVF